MNISAAPEPDPAKATTTRRPRTRVAARLEPSLTAPVLGSEKSASVLPHIDPTRPLPSSIGAEAYKEFCRAVAERTADYRRIFKDVQAKPCENCLNTPRKCCPSGFEAGFRCTPCVANTKLCSWEQDFLIAALATYLDMSSDEAKALCQSFERDAASKAASQNPEDLQSGRNCHSTGSRKSARTTNLPRQQSNLSTAVAQSHVIPKPEPTPEVELQWTPPPQQAPPPVTRRTWSSARISSPGAATSRPEKVSKLPDKVKSTSSKVNPMPASRKPAENSIAGKNGRTNNKKAVEASTSEKKRPDDFEDSIGDGEIIVSVKRPRIEPSTDTSSFGSLVTRGRIASTSAHSTSSSRSELFYMPPSPTGPKSTHSLSTKATPLGAPTPHFQSELNPATPGSQKPQSTSHAPVPSASSLTSAFTRECSQQLPHPDLKISWAPSSGLPDSLEKLLVPHCNALQTLFSTAYCDLLKKDSTIHQLEQQLAISKAEVVSVKQEILEVKHESRRIQAHPQAEVEELIKEMENTRAQARADVLVAEREVERVRALYSREISLLRNQVAELVKGKSQMWHPRLTTGQS